MIPEMTSSQINLIINILWFLFAAGIVILFRRVIRDDLLPYTRSIEFAGVKMTFYRVELDKAIEKRNAQVSEAERSQVLQRARRAAAVLQGAQILWVDDHPLNNTFESQILRSLGTTIDIATSTNEAASLLTRKAYNAIISNMKRDGAADEGLQFLDDVRRKGIDAPVVFYVGRYEPSRGVPPYAFGMTNRPDELLHYVLDILERERS